MEENKSSEEKSKGLSEEKLNGLSEDKLNGLDKYWVLIGAELLSSVKRVCRYLEMDPSETWQDFGFIDWSEKKYSNEQVLNFVKSPEFVTIFEHYLKVGDEIIKESAETREQDAKRRKIAKDEEDKKKREENARLSQLTREERQLELESMKIPDLKNLYRRLSGSGNKSTLIDRILNHEIENNKLKV